MEREVRDESSATDVSHVPTGEAEAAPPPEAKVDSKHDSKLGATYDYLSDPAHAFAVVRDATLAEAMERQRLG